MPATIAASSPAPTAQPLVPPGDLFVFFYNEGFLSRTDVAGSEVEVLAPVSAAIEDASRAFVAYPPRLSPDGRWLIVPDSRGHWTLFDLEEKVEADSGSGQTTLSPSWSPDSQRFVYLADNQLCFHSLSGENPPCLFEQENLLGVQWSPAGTHLAVAQADPTCCTGQVWLISLPTGAAEVIGAYATAPDSGIDDIVAWSSDGSHLLIQSTDNVPSAIFSLSDETTTHFDQPVRDMSPDGQYVLLQEGETGIVGTIGSVDGAMLYSLPDACEAERPASQAWAWSPDGEQLAYVALCLATDRPLGQLYVLQASTGERLWQQQLPDITIRFMFWSPDGAYLLLDEADALPQESPIWRLAADGSRPLETLMEQGFLLGVVP